MGDPDHVNDQRLIANLVDDPVFPLPCPIEIIAHEFFATWPTGVVGNDISIFRMFFTSCLVIERRSFATDLLNFSSYLAMLFQVFKQGIEGDDRFANSVFYDLKILTIFFQQQASRFIHQFRDRDIG